MIGKKKKNKEKADVKAKAINTDELKEELKDVLPNKTQEEKKEILIPELLILEELRGLRLDMRYVFDELNAMHKTLKEAIEDEE